MTTAELRLGNLFDNHGAICQVISISKNSAEFGYFEDSIGFERRFDNESLLPKPISLTEEWLLKFGFECTKGSGFNPDIFRLKSFEIKKHKSLTNDAFCVDELSYLFKTEESWIDYVHQLQNLYWCLVGEELTIKQLSIS